MRFYGVRNLQKCTEKKHGAYRKKFANKSTCTGFTKHCFLFSKIKQTIKIKCFQGFLSRGQKHKTFTHEKCTILLWKHKIYSLTKVCTPTFIYQDRPVYTDYPYDFLQSRFRLLKFLQSRLRLLKPFFVCFTKLSSNYKSAERRKRTSSAYESNENGLCPAVEFGKICQRSLLGCRISMSFRAL